jgi:RHS repeat-associated protein
MNWNRMGAAGAIESAYVSGWTPAGAGAVFSFLPRVNAYQTSARRRYSEDGSVSFVDTGLPNTWIPDVATLGTTYFSTFEPLAGVYFEYWAGTNFDPIPPSPPPASDPLFGTLNRRYDRNGNELRYTYSPANGGSLALLRKITGDLGGNVVPYFEYADETDPQCPVSKIYIADLASPQNSRTLYFEYASYLFTDGHSIFTAPYLSRIVSPAGCERRYTPRLPLPLYGITEIQQEVDPEGYTTYFEYAPGTNIMNKAVEPEGRITYYGYLTESLTSYALLGRPRSFIFYGSASGGGEMPAVLSSTDALGNTTYFDYNLSIIRQQTQIDPNGNVTYWEYLNSGPVRWGMTRKVSGFNGASTYFGYAPTTYDLVKEVGPRHTSSFLATTYYKYDGLRNLLSSIDPLGGTKLYGRDSLGRLFRLRDALGNATYFNYASTTGALTSRVDATGAVSYFGYNSFLDVTSQVSPRWMERNSFALFTTYFEYDALDRQIKKVDAQNNVTYFDWTNRGDILAAVDPLGTVTAYQYNGLRLMTRKTITALGGATLQDAVHGYDIYKNLVRSLDSRGNATYFGFDAIDRLTVMKDALGGLTYYSYDSVGNLTAQTDARNFTASHFYDPLSRRICSRTPLGQLTYFGYDLSDNRSRILDPRGNATYFFFDQLDRLQAGRDALGNTTYYFYDAGGNTAVVRDVRFSSTYYGYDGLNRLTRRRDPLGNATYFGYDAASNRTRVLDARRNATYYIYDTLDHLHIIVDAVGSATYFGFDALGYQTRMLDPRGNSAYFFYNGLNRITATLDALGNATYFEFDGNSNLVRKRGARGGVTDCSFDALNRCVSERTAEGNLLLKTYDQVGNISAQCRAFGLGGYGEQSYGLTFYGGAGGIFPWTYFAYDSNNQLITSQDEAGFSTYFEYDAARNMSRLVDARGNARLFRYDALDRLSATRDALGNSTYYFYDPSGNRSVLRNPLLHNSYFGYDARNNLIRAQNALGSSVYYEFDSMANPIKRVDENTHATLTRFDALNRPDSIRAADGGSTYFYYDPVSNRSKQLSPIGAATYYAYDAANRTTRMQDPLGRAVYFEYDAVGNLSALVDAEGASSSHSYDLINRKTRSVYAPVGAAVSSSLATAHYYSYDISGELAQMTDLWGTHVFGYDSRHRKAKHFFPSGKTVYFNYDGVSNVVVRVYPDSSGKWGAAYDGSDRQTLVQSPSGATAYFSYDAASNLMRRLYGNGAKEVMTYDAAEQIATWRGADKNGAMLAYFDYTRDAKGLVVKCVREATHTTYHLYDANDRLVAETWLKGTGNKTAEVYGYRYAYDLAGNRTKARINGADTYYFYDQASQLKVTGTNAVYANPTYFFYDRNGSLTNWWDSGGATYFAYNAAGLAARIRWRDASATYFFYDGSLKRYAMVSAGQTAATYFLWDGLDLLQELNADGTVKEEHTHAQTAIPGIGQLLETNRPGQTPQKLYPILDPRGTILRWMQADGTTVQAAREYDGFGQIIPNSATGTWPGKFGYQGQSWIELLSANGSQRLLLSATRLYNPSLGRFLQNDPVPGRRPANGYGYASSNPALNIDVYGQQTQDSLPRNMQDEPTLPPVYSQDSLLPPGYTSQPPFTMSVKDSFTQTQPAKPTAGQTTQSSDGQFPLMKDVITTYQPGPKSISDIDVMMEQGAANTLKQFTKLKPDADVSDVMNSVKKGFLDTGKTELKNVASELLPSWVGIKADQKPGLATIFEDGALFADGKELKVGGNDKAGSKMKYDYDLPGVGSMLNDGEFSIGGSLKYQYKDENSTFTAGLGVKASYDFKGENKGNADLNAGLQVEWSAGSGTPKGGWGKTKLDKMDKQIQKFLDEKMKDDEMKDEEKRKEEEEKNKKKKPCD